MSEARTSVRGMTTETMSTIHAGMSEMATGMDAVSACLRYLSVDELPEAITELERIETAMHDMQLRIVGRLHRMAPPVALGGPPLSVTLSARWRISESEARRRIAKAIELGYG
jgi:hypothetical protein